MNVVSVIEKIKKSKNISSDKEFAMELGIKYDTLRNWVRRNTLDIATIIDYANKSGLDFNYLFTDDEDRSTNTLLGFLSDDQRTYHYKALELAYDNDDAPGFMLPLIKYYIFQTIQTKFQNIGAEGKFWDKILFGQRVKNAHVLILGKVLSEVQETSNLSSVKIDNALDKLGQFVSQYQLKLIQDKGKHFLANKEKDNLADWINVNIDNDEAYFILKNIPHILDLLREESNRFNKTAF